MSSFSWKPIGSFEALIAKGSNVEREREVKIMFGFHICIVQGSSKRHSAGSLFSLLKTSQVP